jgi:hypothetical protein
MSRQIAGEAAFLLVRELCFTLMREYSASQVLIAMGPS